MFRALALLPLLLGCGRFSFDDRGGPRRDGAADSSASGDGRVPDGAFEAIASGAIGYWQFDGDLSDRAAVPHAGTCVYGCPGFAPGLRGSAADFHDVEGVEIGIADPFNTLVGPVTFAAWVNLRSLTQYGAIISDDRDCANCGTTTGIGLWSSLYAGAPYFLLWNATMQPFGPSGGATLATGTWIFVAGTYDGSLASLYLDGSLVGTATRTSAIGTPHTYPLRIGHQGFDYAGGLDGLIDEVMVFDRALSAAEIATIYESLR